MNGVRTLSVRLRPEAYGELEARAKEEGRTLAGYARARLFDEVDPAVLVELRAELAEIKQLLLEGRGS